MLNEKNITALLSLFFILFATGFLFHRSSTFAGTSIGHILGIVGTIIVFLTLIYPFRKRVLKRKGKENPLNTHTFYGLIGPSLVLMHSAHKFGSLIGTVCLTSIFFMVLSGIVGRFLFRRASRTLKEQKSDLDTLKKLLAERREDMEKCRKYLEMERTPAEACDTDEHALCIGREGQYRCEFLVELATSVAELEYTVAFFSQAKTLFSRWARVHHVLAVWLFAMIIVHILTTLYYGLRWLR